MRVFQPLLRPWLIISTDLPALLQPTSKHQPTPAPRSSCPFLFDCIPPTHTHTHSQAYAEYGQEGIPSKGRWEAPPPRDSPPGEEGAAEGRCVGRTAGPQGLGPAVGAPPCPHLFARRGATRRARPPSDQNGSGRTEEAKERSGLRPDEAVGPEGGIRNWSSGVPASSHPE